MDDSTELGSIAAELRELSAAPSDLLLRGTRIDEQYEIERVIGNGAMGVVYLARDLRLERKVAIKLARERSPAALARASREAVSLARLSHPNVVVVHQVGTLDGRVYVAMEYVAGATARVWCEARDVRSILALYAAVGDGLAAAHAAGLVHRDFKPDNVLVGEDGRGRVADFGLAVSEASSHDVAGTLAFMAPEQVRGEEIDARADQYAFCASLQHALRTRKVPRHIELALRRGMAADRDARWPAMPALLAELRHDPARQRRRIALVVGIPLLAVAALATPQLTATTPATPVDACAGGPARIAPLWSAERRAQVARAIAPGGAPAWLSTLATVVTGATDAWTARWSSSYRAVCEAGWTPALHDRGMQCLSRGEHALAATVDGLAEAGLDPSRLDALVAQLPRPESCTDPLYLDAIVPPPTDPVLARAVAETEDQLQRVAALQAAGKADRAKSLLATIDDHLPSYAPLRARVAFAHAINARDMAAETTATTAYREAYFEARAAGDRVTAASAASGLAVALIDDSHDDDAANWARLAEVEVIAIADPALQGGVLHALSIVATARGQPQRGVELADRSMHLTRAMANAHQLGQNLATRAQAYDGLGSYDQALADLDAAGSAVRAIYGPVHPDLSAIEQQRALVLVHLGRTADAITAARAGLSIAEATSSDPATLFSAIGSLGMALEQAHQLPEALVMLDRSIELTSKTEGERSYNVASDLNNRCDLLAQMGRNDDAIADGRRALAIWTAILAADASELGIVHYNIALALINADRYAAAKPELDRAIAIFDKQPDHQWLALVLTSRGIVERATEHLVPARADLERAIELLSAPGGDPARLAAARLELARVARADGRAEVALTPEHAR